MCCFSATTKVERTSIFARFLKPGTQALVYRMQYAATQPTAMILPLPVALPARDGSVQFTSLEAYPHFFADLAAGFPHRRTWGRGASKGIRSTTPTLEVHEVGDYVATFIPSLNDFDRIDPRFLLPRNVWSRVPIYSNYGFAVFQLKELSGSPHPIALEFETRMPGTLFFPTVHIHDGTVHDSDDFDHALYAQETLFDDAVSGYGGPDAVDTRTGYVRSRSKASAFANVAGARGLIDGNLLVHRMTLLGNLPNIDTLLDARAVLQRKAGCGRCDARGVGSPAEVSLPVAATIAGLSWILRRRNQLRSDGEA